MASEYRIEVGKTENGQQEFCVDIYEEWWENGEPVTELIAQVHDKATAELFIDMLSIKDRAIDQWLNEEGGVE